MSEHDDPFVDILALGSPSGHMSRRALKAAQDRLGRQLFPDGMPAPAGPAQPSVAAYKRQEAAQLRDLAARGMKPRAYMMKAAWLEAEAAAIDNGEEMTP